MKIILTVFLLSIATVYSQGPCVVWNFEDNLEDSFDVCDSSDSWQHLLYDYASTDIPEPPDDLMGGTYYVTPTSDGSCGITITPISVTTEGILQVNFYIETAEDSTSNEASACIEVRDSASNNLLGDDCIYPASLENGWHRINIEIVENSDEAHIFLHGESFVGSNILIDSILYIEYSGQECSIYSKESEGVEETDEDKLEDTDEEDKSGDTDEGDQSERESEEDHESESEGDYESESEGDSEETDIVEPPGVLPTENDGLSTGLIVGIAIGSILIVIAVGLLTYFLGLKQGTKKAQPPEYSEDIQSHIMDNPRNIIVPRVKVAGPETPPLDYYNGNNGNNEPQVYKLEIHNHFSR